MDETPGLSERTPLLSVTALDGTQSGSGFITRSDRHADIPKQGYSVCIRTVVLILIAVFCERLAFFSIFFNMVLFCMYELNFTSFEASTIYWICTGTAYVIMPLIGGYIADSVCGRYRTMIGSGFIFLIGTILLFFSAADFIHWFGQDIKDVRKALIITGLVVVTVGSGGLQANIIPFGAQHITHLGPRAVQSFCHWYYWARNLGCIASSSVVYLQQETKQFHWGYLMSMLILLAGLVIFRLGKNIYNHVPPSESVLKKAFIMCCNTWRRKRQHFEVNQIETSYIHEVKNVLKILPIYGFVTIYWMSYAQMSTSLFLQSERLDISFGDVTIPPAFLIYFNAVMLVLFIPLMDFVIYPLLIRCGKGPTNIQRIGIGMFLAVLALCYAGGLELCRKNHGHFQQEISNIYYSSSNMSIFHQVPVFTLLGLSEIWTGISGYQDSLIPLPLCVLFTFSNLICNLPFSLVQIVF